MLGYGTGRFGYLSINLIQLIEDLKTASKNTKLPILLVPNPTYQNPGEGRKTKGKQEKRVLLLVGGHLYTASVFLIFRNNTDGVGHLE